jgi:hypothetical protein
VLAATVSLLLLFLLLLLLLLALQTPLLQVRASAA